MAEIEVKDVEMKDAADTTGVVEATAQQETSAAADGEVEPELIPTVPLRKYTLESKYRETKYSLSICVSSGSYFKCSIAIKLLNTARIQNGLRHNDYKRYREYCSRRLHRLRKSLRFLCGRGRYIKRTIDPDLIRNPK